MAKGNNQKLKIIYLMKILLKKTDETHSITMQEIITALESYGVSAERKSIYNDIENLRLFGMDIIGEQRERTFYYHVGNRQFELAELKLFGGLRSGGKIYYSKKIKRINQENRRICKRVRGFPVTKTGICVWAY